MRHIILSALIALSFIGPAAAQTLKSGTFVAGDVGHDGAGAATLVQTENGFEIQITALQSDPGPDLRMILIRADDAITTPAIKASDYVILGDLISISGDQTYPVPSEIDASSYGTVAVWCEEFGVLFTAAPIK